MVHEEFTAYGVGRIIADRCRKTATGIAHDMHDTHTELTVRGHGKVPDLE